MADSPRLDPPAMPAWLADPLPSTRYRLDVGGGHRMHVVEEGEGLPVVMVHGNPSWSFSYRKVAGALRGGDLRVVLPDLVGLGFSDKPPAPQDHTLERHIAWFGRALDQLALEEAVFVVQDWGGAIAVGALAERPHLRAGLVILNTVLTPPRRGFRPKLFHRFSQAPLLSDLVFRRLGFPQSVLTFAQGDKSSIRGRVADAYRFPLQGMANNAAPLGMARMAPDSFSHPSIAPLERCGAYVDGFDGPAAIVWGDHDPVLGSVRSWMQKLFPDAPITRTAAGHFVQEEVPEAVAAAVEDVAARLRA